MTSGDHTFSLTGGPLADRKSIQTPPPVHTECSIMPPCLKDHPHQLARSPARPSCFLPPFGCDWLETHRHRGSRDAHTNRD